MSQKAVITAISHYVPPTVYKNDYFTEFLDTTDEWIRTRTGIIERRFDFAAATSDLMLPAALDCLEQRQISANEIDVILVATITPDHTFPSTACILQNKLHAKNAWGYDIFAACSGFLFALETARRMVESGGAKRVLVASGDRMSSILDFQDRATCILFGDGAGVCLVEASEDQNIGIHDSILHIDGSGLPNLHMKSGGSASPTTQETVSRREHFVFQDGKSVFKSAVVGMADVAGRIMERNNLQAHDIAWLVPHQANLRIIDATAQRMQLDASKVMINIEKYGNTTAGTIPICLSEWHKAGKIQYGDKIILASFGAGYTWGSIYLTWGIK